MNIIRVSICLIDNRSPNGDAKLEAAITVTSSILQQDRLEKSRFTNENGEVRHDLM